MLTMKPYDPIKDDLFLYQDELITWSGGSATVKVPYAWNPNSTLYDYRRSLEGIRAPYRNFSSPHWVGPPVGPVQQALFAANPDIPVNYPITRNSWPPTAYFGDKRKFFLCEHCWTTVFLPRYQTLNLTLQDFFSSTGAYTVAMSSLRFIDGDNNIATLQSSLFEYPYVRDQHLVYPRDTCVSAPHPMDKLVTLYSQDFPFNPVVLLDAGSVPTDRPWYYLNAGNMIIQDMSSKGSGEIGRVPLNDISVSQPFAPFGPVQSGIHAIGGHPYDLPYMHDSSSLFVTPIQLPSYVGAGDGILGVAHGHLLSSISFIQYDTVDQPQVARTHMQPVFGSRDNDPEFEYFKQYWINRGHPYPEPIKFKISKSTPKAQKVPIDYLAQQVATIRASNFPGS